jgi:PAS domain S-box-containing protein
MHELFQGMYDAAFITDSAGIIINANTRAEQFFQYTRDEFIGANIGEVARGMSPAVLETICKNLENDKFTLIQAWCERKDDTLLSAEISASRLNLSGRSFLCFFIRDVTARKEAEDAIKKAHDELTTEMQERIRINEELKAAIAKLEEHDKAKTDFVSNVSHELKTPLTSINYVAGNMLKGIAGPVSKQATEYLGMIREDCQRLKRTVDDILDMSRIEANSMKLSRNKIQFAEFVRRTVESMRVQVEAAGLTLEINIKPSKLFVDCDCQKMERMIFNLVKNSMKFNVINGSIRVSVHEDPSTWRIIMDVQDTGIGIEPRHLDKVTQRFYRIGEYVSGTGLGLAISKEIVERHGGNLHIQSPPPGTDKGTMVSVGLPVASPPIAFLIYQHDEVRLPAIQQMDDYGYRIFAEPNRDGVAEKLQEYQPDLILLDWVLPGMDGSIIVGRLKSDEKLRNTPILAIVGKDAEQMKKEILDGFGIPLLTFPWQPAAFYHCVEDMLMSRKGD